MKLKTPMTIYRKDGFKEYLNSEKFGLVRGVKKLKYYNIPNCFDIETTSFYVDENGNAIDYATLIERRKAIKTPYLPQKAAIMYIWQMAIDGVVFVGRTWKEFKEACEILVEELELDENKRVIVYVHNLAFEFQFIRKMFNWSKVFALEVRKPLYAITENGIEFRCSYLLSGYSLAKLGDQLQKYKVQKLMGNLDYSKLRHAQTLLTPQELDYCVNDCKVVCAYIQEQIEQYGNINKLPLTNTGRVREYCRNACFYEDGKRKKKSRKRRQYRDFIKDLALTPDEYLQLKRAFQGGFTHASAMAVPVYTDEVIIEKIHKNVTSIDFTSSYPYVMLSEKFPMSPAELVNPIDRRTFYKSLKLYCCLFDVRFYGIQSKIYHEHYISASRCIRLDGAEKDNGRIVSAHLLYTTLTEQDFFIIKKCYTWEKMEVTNFRRYRKGYLPTDFVKSIIKLYQDKTQLKGVDGKETEYLNSKGMLNSTYGMCVTDIVRPEIIYTDDWPKTEDLLTIPGVTVELEEFIEKYNRSSTRFLYYPWGVWVTAYARHNLWTGIFEFGPDYLYSDTDSLKVLNIALHSDYIKHYNRLTQQKLKRAAEFHSIPFENFTPATIKGIRKPLGVWDFDGEYLRFKTLGAKRYLVQYSDHPANDHPGELALTVAGLGKKSALKYLMERCKEPTQVFNMFNDEMYIPPEATGKNTHTYIDTPLTGEMTDYLGNRAFWSAETSVHLEPAEYDLSLTQEYKEFILKIGDYEK